MLKQAVRKGFRAEYALTDKWFISEQFILQVRKIKRGMLHVLSACKMDKRGYLYRGKKYTAKELLRNLKSHKKRCRKLNAFYFEVLVEYKGVPIK